MPTRLIRIRASAAIVRGGRILLIACDDARIGWHYNLPGGGVEPGETLHDAVRREVREETTAPVEVGPLLLTWEYCPDGQKRSNAPHTLGMVFRCTLPAGAEPALPPLPDEHQVAVEWVPLADLPAVPLEPRIAAELLVALQAQQPFDPFVAGVQERSNA